MAASGFKTLSGAATGWGAGEAPPWVEGTRRGPVIWGGSFISGCIPPCRPVRPKQPVPTALCRARGEMVHATQLNSHCRPKYLR